MWTLSETDAVGFGTLELSETDAVGFGTLKLSETDATGCAFCDISRRTNGLIITPKPTLQDNIVSTG